MNDYSSIQVSPVRIWEDEKEGGYRLFWAHFEAWREADDLEWIIGERFDLVEGVEIVWAATGAWVVDQSWPTCNDRGRDFWEVRARHLRLDDPPEWWAAG